MQDPARLDVKRLNAAIAPLAVGAAVFLLALGCLTFTRETGRVAAVWPVNAIVIAVMLRAAPGAWARYLVAGLLGNIAADLAVGDSLTTALELSACNSLEIAICVGLSRRMLGQQIDLGRPRDLVMFLLTAGVLAPLAAAICAVLTLSHLRVAPILPTLLGWYVPDALGLLIVTPTLLALTPEAVGALDRSLRHRRGALSILVAGVSLVTVFGQQRYPILFLIPPALIFVAFELNLAGAALGLLATATVAVVMTLTGHGPAMLIKGGLSDKLAVLEVFLATLTVSVLPVAAALAKRQRLDEALRASLIEVQALQATTAEANRISTLAQQVAGIGHWRRRRGTDIGEWSDQVYAIHGVTRDNFASSAEAIRELYHPDDRELMKATIERTFLTGEPFDITVHLRRADDGAERFVTFRGEAERDADGEVEAVIGVLHDVTEEVTARERITASETRFRLLTDNATDVIVCYGADGIVTFLSPAVKVVMGYEPEELIGKPTTSIMHPDDVGHVMRSVRAYVAEGPDATPIHFEYRAYRRDGTMIWLEAHPKAVHDPATGAFVEYQDVVRDITARVRLQDELRAARDAAEAATAVKSDFMANMSHEIRTPLTAILGFTSLLAGRSDLDVTAQTQVDRVSAAGQALLAIVNDVLDFSKLEAGQVEIKARPVSPGDVLRDALLMFTPQAEAKGLTLSFEADDSLPPALLIDPDRVRQILLNLIGNAVKFTEHGAIHVSASYARKTQRLKVQVKDTGAGMTKAQQQQLFQRFSQVDASTTRRHGGTGLGLAICRGLAEAMGGDVGVRSRPGRGSVFHFQIEAPIAEAATVDAEAADLAGLLADLRVLVVDDNPVNRELARIVLESLGAEVTEAEDGLTAVELASQLPVDVILLDIRMPGLGGREALAEIRTRDGPNQDVPILAFTADTDVEISPGGFDGLVRKPIVPVHLAEAIHRATLWEDPDALLEAADAAAL